MDSFNHEKKTVKPQDEKVENGDLAKPEKDITDGQESADVSVTNMGASTKPDKGKGKATEKLSFASYAAALQGAKAQPGANSGEQVMNLLFKNGIPATSGFGATSARDAELFGDAPADVDNANDFYELRFETARFEMGEFVNAAEAVQREYTKILRTAHSKGKYRLWLEAKQRKLEEEFIGRSVHVRHVRGG